jgi:hypothetical protein
VQKKKKNSLPAFFLKFDFGAQFSCLIHFPTYLNCHLDPFSFTFTSPSHQLIGKEESRIHQDKVLQGTYQEQCGSLFWDMHRPYYIIVLLIVHRDESQLSMMFHLWISNGTSAVIATSIKKSENPGKIGGAWLVKFLYLRQFPFKCSFHLFSFL